MSENQSTPKSSDLSNLPRGAISIKGLPLNRNTRLPSIRTPRDLTLGAQPKRVFTPNIPVRREKKVILPNVENSQKKVEPKFDKKSPVINKGKHIQRNIIQTEGTLFGEGVAASKSRSDRQREAAPRFTPRRPIVKKEFDMSEMENNINELLRDDFIDDDDDDDDEDELKPVIYPITNAEKTAKKDTVKSESKEEQSFEDNFAKQMGYDVEKIARFIKKEKCSDDVIEVPQIELPPNTNNELLDLFKSEQMFLLQFPKEFNVTQPDDPRESLNSSETSTVKHKDKCGLSSLPEGSIGKLQIMKSGRVKLIVGDYNFDLNLGTALKNKHEVHSIRLDQSSNDMAVLGNIEHKLIVIPDVDKFIEPFR